VAPEAVIEAIDTETIYSIPVTFEDEGFADLVTDRLHLPKRDADLGDWRTIVERVLRPSREVNVKVVGKYTGNGDAYISVGESLKHAGIHHDCRVTLDWVDSEELESTTPEERLAGGDAVVVCGGFGARGVEGKIAAVRYARETGVPYLGLCYGMQMAVIEYARHVCGLSGANTTEVDPETPHPVIALMTDQYGVTDKGATMRLGLWPCALTPGSLAEKLYGAPVIEERHRHRFEVNNAYREQLARGGLVFCGQSPDKKLVEMVELTEHPFFIATQFHPEFRSRPNRAHPLFAGVVEAALQRRQAEAGPKV
jgi:CTP synthase